MVKIAAKESLSIRHPSLEIVNKTHIYLVDVSNSKKTPFLAIAVSNMQYFMIYVKNFV